MKYIQKTFDCLKRKAKMINASIGYGEKRKIQIQRDGNKHITSDTTESPDKAYPLEKRNGLKTCL